MQGSSFSQYQEIYLWPDHFSNVGHDLPLGSLGHISRLSTICGNFSLRAPYLQCGDKGHLHSPFWDSRLHCPSFCLGLGLGLPTHSTAYTPLTIHACFCIETCMEMLGACGGLSALQLPNPIGQTELCSYCRLLGYGRPGAVPEHACLLLPQGSRLHHGMKPVGW